MRCFIAIDIPPQARDAIADLQDDLQRYLPLPAGSLRWILPAQMHLTLRFIGEQEREDIDEICRLLPSVVAGREPFDIELSALGFFGSPVKTLWLGSASVNSALVDLQRDIETALASRGIARERRPFNGHLTLGRISNAARDRSLKDAIMSYRLPAAMAFRAEAVCLYRSKLTPASAIYTLLNRIELQ